MKHLTFYGASDDLFEIEGDIREEICASAKEKVTFTTAGIEITVKYEGVWGIYVKQIDEDIPVTAENLKLSVEPRMNGGQGYSMRLDMDVPDDCLASVEQTIREENEEDAVEV